MIYKSDHQKKDMCLSFNLTTLDMIEFVSLPPIWRIIYEVAMETMHFHKALTKFLLRGTSFHILRVPLNNLAWI